MNNLNNIQPDTNKKLRNKKMKRFNNIVNILENHEMKIREEVEDVGISDYIESYKVSKTLQESNRPNVIKKEKIKNKNEELNTIRENFLREAYFKLFNECFLMEEDVKLSNESYMREQSDEMVNYLIKNNLLEDTGCYITDRINSLSLSFSNECYNLEDSMKPFLEETYQKELNYYIESVSEIVKKKVAKSVSYEKHTSNFIMKEEVKLGYKKEKQSLLRSLVINNFKNALNENTGMSKVALTKISFVESLYDYTILETMNTLNIIQADATLKNKVSMLYK